MAKEKKVADSDGLHLYGWMRNILHLSGGELITFAIVFRSSQSNSGIYTGGIPYVAEFVGCSKETARKYLHDLEGKGLIEGMDVDKNGVRYRNYQVIDNHIPKKFGYIPKNTEGDTQNLEGGIPKNFGAEEYNTKNIISTTPRFIPPTLEMISAYAEIRRNAGNPPIDPQAFYNYNEASGWKVGNKPMKDWKAAFRTWEDKRRQDQQKAAPRQHTSVNWDDIKI